MMQKDIQIQDGLFAQVYLFFKHLQANCHKKVLLQSIATVTVTNITVSNIPWQFSTMI